MNFGKVLNLIAQNNIDPEKVFEIVEKVKNADLKDESTIRGLIKEISVLANKQIDKEQEDKLNVINNIIIILIIFFIFFFLFLFWLIILTTKYIQ